MNTKIAPEESWKLAERKNSSSMPIIEPDYDQEINLSDRYKTITTSIDLKRNGRKQLSAQGRAQK